MADDALGNPLSTSIQLYTVRCTLRLRAILFPQVTITGIPRYRVTQCQFEHRVNDNYRQFSFDFILSGKHRRIRATISGNFIRWMMIYRDPLIHYVDDIFEFVNFRIYVGIFAIQVSRNFILLRVTVLGIPRYRVTGMVICELINDIYGELMSTLTRFYSIGKRRWTRTTVSDNFIRWMMIYRGP